MTWFRLTRRGVWHAQFSIRQSDRWRCAYCWVRDFGAPGAVRYDDPPANEPRCKRCVQAMEGQG